MALLLVHGRSQEGKDPKALKEQWVKALTRGVEQCDGRYSSDDATVFFPYYGDVLIAAMQASNLTNGADGLKSAQDNEAEAYRALELAFIAKAVQADPKKSLADVARIAELFPGTADLVLSFMKDAAAYLGRDEVRQRVHNVVRPVLEECADFSHSRSEPLILVGHSLGSVVLHDILSVRGETPVIDLFVTIGSPLGTPAVYKRLQGARERVFWPNSVRKWLNVSDPDDVVALKSTLGRSNLFKSAKEGTRSDVLNLVDVMNTSNNHHGIIEYLSDPGVARGVTQLLWKAAK